MGIGSWLDTLRRALARAPLPAPARWLRHWRAGAAALVALAGLALLTLGPAGVTLGIRDYQRQQAQAVVTDRPYLGSEVRDGPVAFIVHAVQCGRTERAANGKLCEVTIAARNDGAEPVRVLAAGQLLYGSGGARFRPAGREPEPFGTIGPGEAATARLRFDVPPRSTVSHLEVHAGPYTRGQVVSIGGPPLPLPGAE